STRLRISCSTTELRRLAWSVRTFTSYAGLVNRRCAAAHHSARPDELGTVLNEVLARGIPGECVESEATAIQFDSCREFQSLLERFCEKRRDIRGLEAQRGRGPRHEPIEVFQEQRRIAREQIFGAIVRQMNYGMASVRYRPRRDSVPIGNRRDKVFRELIRSGDENGHGMGAHSGHLYMRRFVRQSLLAR